MKKQSNFRRGSRPQTKGKTLDTTEKVDKSTRRGGDNDASWYARAKQLVLDASNLSYASILGSKLEKDTDFYDGQSKRAIPSIPGVMALKWAPAVGISTAPDSAINVASKRLYSFVRHANSGHANYDSPDLMLYILAMDSLYALHAMGLRAYGIARYYLMLNRYVPDILLKACGFDPSIIDDLANFRLFLNTMALKLSAMAVPSEFDLFKRHVWMSSGVYKDSPSEKSQLYAFTPSQLWKFNATKYPEGGCLEVHQFDQLTPLTIEAYKAAVTALSDPIFSDEDMNIMSGDILKAYGNEGIVRVGTIPEDFQIVPEFNMEVLSQIQNASIDAISSGASVKGKGEITQEGNILLFNPELYPMAGKGNNDYKMFTIYADNPTPDMTMVASRLTFLTDIDTETFATSFNAIGSEWITEAQVFGKAWEWDAELDLVYRDFRDRYLNLRISVPFIASGGTPVTPDSVAGTTSYVMRMLSLTKFQMHPIFEVYTPTYTANPSGTSSWFRDYLGDVDNYTQIDRSTIKKMHDAAILSLLHVEGAYRR